MKKPLKVIFNIIAWIILILALIVTLLVFSSDRNYGVANLFGYIPLTVESDSMKPTFKKNDMIIVKEVDDINSLKKGDVITFWTIIDGKKVKNTHRIQQVVDENGTKSFITRGDANDLDDSYNVYGGDIIGQWHNVKIGGFGKVDHRRKYAVNRKFCRKEKCKVLQYGYFQVTAVKLVYRLYLP